MNLHLFSVKLHEDWMAVDSKILKDIKFVYFDFQEKCPSCGIYHRKALPVLNDGRRFYVVCKTTKQKIFLGWQKVVKGEVDFCFMTKLDKKWIDVDLKKIKPKRVMFDIKMKCPVCGSNHGDHLVKKTFFGKFYVMCPEKNKKVYIEIYGA